jgi:hypothetical protein
MYVYLGYSSVYCSSISRYFDLFISSVDFLRHEEKKMFDFS